MNEARNIVRKWQEDEALKRFQMISPLLDAGLDEAKRLQLREKIAEENGISTRSLYRYEKMWREGEFQGLQPQDRKKHRKQPLPANFDELLAEAIQLKREVPQRSVAQIIAILELERRVLPGKLKRSTLQRHLYEAGYGKAQLQMYKDARESSTKRFCKPHRMMLVQADIKYGPYLPIGKNGAKKQTYLSSAIDDHSRYLLSSRFYATQEAEIVEDTFHRAIDRYGRFDECYVDNGSQYVARQLKLSLSRLGIKVRFAPLKSGKSKGKVEKFHQVVDAFLREAKLQKIETLEDLNHYWDLYRDDYYHRMPHDGIKEYYESLGAQVSEAGITPEQEFNRDTRALTYLDKGVVAEAFLHHEKRRVDKGACISFRGKRYETKPALTGFDVEISYDPTAPETVTVRYPGMEPFEARPLKIGAYCDKNPTLPISMQEAPAVSSRLLDGLEARHAEQKARMADAISFADLKEVADYV